MRAWFPTRRRKRPERQESPDLEGAVPAPVPHQAIGNQAMLRRYEHAADAAATTAAAGGRAQLERLPGTGGAVEDEREETGEPLPAAEAARLEASFGQSLSGVRVHTDADANAKAKSMRASAFTVGRDIYFGAGEYAPQTSEGQSLLAHEAAHTVQQSSGAATVQKQDDDKDKPRFKPFTADPSLALPPLFIPGTGITVFPGPLSTGVLGSKIPLPASLRVTNALSASPGASVPTFVLDLSPELLVASILQDINISTGTTPGTPPGKEKDPANAANIQLLHPLITFDPKSRTLRGTAKLSIPTGYPSALKSPTEIDVDISSTELGKFTGTAAYGPLVASFQLQLKYDKARLLAALKPAGSLTGEGVASAAKGEGDELTHPGFDVTGGVTLGPVPLTSFSASAPTTKPLARPLPGAPAAFPIKSEAKGAIIAPAGSLFSVAAPAAGFTTSDFGEKKGTSFTAAALPTISPDAISAGKGFGESFPAYAYGEFYTVRRVSDRLDLGVRITASISSPEIIKLFSGPSASTPPTSVQQFETARDQFIDSEKNKGKPADIKPNFFISVEGRFDAL